MRLRAAGGFGRRVVLAAGLFVGVMSGRAAVADDLVLGPTLRGVAERGTIRLGVRDSAIPFAFTNRAGQPIGFSVDLCHAIAAAAADAIGVELVEADAPAWRKGVRIVYATLASDQRITAMVSHSIDLECGSTTATNERAKEVGFSPVFFLAGTKLMVAADSGVRSYHDLDGKTVVVSAGTTNGAVMRALAVRIPGLRVVDAPDFAAAAHMLDTGAAQAFASDDVLLAGLAASRPALTRNRIVGDYLSFEPYAIMIPKDDAQFEALVNTTFHQLAEGSQLRSLYRRWFMEKLPNGKTINLPINPQLAEIYRALGEPD